MRTVVGVLNGSLVRRVPDVWVRVGGVVGFALLTALCAQVRVPMYPVPMTLQTLAVAVCALTMGPRLGMASMGVYLGLGAGGLPVFSGLSGGIGVLAGATGGYLIGFVLAQPVIALLSRRWGGGLAGSIGSVLVGFGVVYAVGVPWLKVALGIQWWAALWSGMAVFVPGMVCKAVAAGLIGVRSCRVWAGRGW